MTDASDVSERRKKQQEKIQENKSDKIENKHVVKKGDTLYSISKKFNISVSELVKINDIKKIQ